MNTKAFRSLSYGVYVISSLDNGRCTGCIANSVMQITSSPATIAVSMNHDNFTNSCIAESGLFSVSILAENSDPGLIGRFGFQSGKDTFKFAGVDFKLTESGLPVVNDACGYICCKVIDKMETSTHTVFLGEVIDADVLKNEPAMTYAYYHNVVKGKSPKNAPSYLPEEDDSKASAEKKWVCGICGYVYDGDVPFEELPDTYVCPICKQSKDQFKEQ